MADSVICPVCGTEHSEKFVFCPECGCNLSEAEAVMISVNPSSGSLAESVKNQVQSIGQKAQQGISGVTTAISDKAKAVSSRASNIVVQEKVTEAMGNLVNLMINVSKDITKQVPVDMIGAIDLEAEVNFVAFTIGVSIDLAELNKAGKKPVKEP